MGWLADLLSRFDPACVLATLAAVAILGFVGLLRGWFYKPGDYKRLEASEAFWRGIAVPSLQMSGNLAEVVKNET